MRPADVLEFAATLLCALFIFLAASLANLVAAPALPGSKSGGVFVLDDCDPDFRGKGEVRGQPVVHRRHREGGLSG